MTPEQLLSHIDSGQLWPAATAGGPPGPDVAASYQQALAVRRLRQARGEQPRGYKIGFTNRSIWSRYNVHAPIWGTVWDTTLTFCDGRGELDLAGTCQPRIEPELVFGLRSTPLPDCDFDTLFDSIEWMAPGFEIVQSHCLHWKFTAAETVADSGLHARLLVGRQTPVRMVANDAARLEHRLGAAGVVLTRYAEAVDQGCGTNVLDGPLHALLHFVRELRGCPGAPTLMAGDVITTGTWTDAWPVLPGESWIARFDAPVTPLEVRFVRS